MTIEDIEKALPNGLHDAQIEEFKFDFEEARVTLRLCVWVGTPPEVERYRTGLLVFSRVAFLSFETPRSQLRFEYPAALDFTCKRVGLGWIPAQLLKNITPDTLAYSVYVHDYLSEFNIAAASVDFKWLEDEPPESSQ